MTPSKKCVEIADKILREGLYPHPNCVERVAQLLQDSGAFADGWVSVETPPTEEAQYNVCDEDGNVFTCDWFVRSEDQEGFWLGFEGEEVFGIVFYRRLPAPPEDK